MGYYHIKNIKVDRKNNSISADLADSNWEPLDWFYVDNLSDSEKFENKYANFIYNLVSGNFHPSPNNKYSKIVLNSLLDNYYDDAHDIGELETYNKYKNVIKGIMNDDYSKCIKLKSDRELNPSIYYALNKVNIDSKYEGDYYTNEKGELYCFNNNELKMCSKKNNDYGYPLCIVSNIDKFKEYNDFLNEKDSEIEL